MESRIYCVFNPNVRAPRFAHASYDSAKAEAKRLAKLNPDQPFYVMESVGMAIKHDVSFYAQTGHVRENTESPISIVLQRAYQSLQEQGGDHQ